MSPLPWLMRVGLIAIGILMAAAGWLFQSNNSPDYTDRETFELVVVGIILFAFGVA